MKIIKILIFLSMIIIAIAYWIGARPTMEVDLNASRDEVVSQGSEVLPKFLDFSLPNQKGEKIALSNFKGKPVLLNFWATWCPPCEQELPSLLKLAQWGASEVGLVTLAVSVDSADVDIHKFLKEKKFWPGGSLPFTILLDPNAAIAASYGAKKYPETIFINRKQEVVRRFVGLQDWMSEEMKRWIIENAKSDVQ